MSNEQFDALAWAKRAAEALRACHNWMQGEFSDSDFDRDGKLSEADAAAFSAAYDADKAIAAIALMRGQSEGVIRLPELPEQDVEGVRFDGFSISAMEDFARRAVAMNERSCVWTIDADPYAEMWNGACGIAWTFTEGGPADNECNHCPKCGGRIEITDQPKDTADEQ